MFRGILSSLLMQLKCLSASLGVMKISKLFSDCEIILKWSLIHQPWLLVPATPLDSRWCMAPATISTTPECRAEGEHRTWHVLWSEPLDQAGIHGTKSVLMKKMGEGPGNMAWFGSLPHSWTFLPQRCPYRLRDVVCELCCLPDLPGRPSQWSESVP